MYKRRHNVFVTLNSATFQHKYRLTEEFIYCVVLTQSDCMQEFEEGKHADRSATAEPFSFWRWVTRIYYDSSKTLQENCRFCFLFKSRCWWEGSVALRTTSMVACVPGYFQTGSGQGYQIWKANIAVCSHIPSDWNFRFSKIETYDMRSSPCWNQITFPFPFPFLHYWFFVTLISTPLIFYWGFDCTLLRLYKISQ